jgi:hypothetical protein
MAATLTFLTPVGILLALGGLLPLIALVLIVRHAARVRSRLGVSSMRAHRLVAPLVALVTASVLVGLAAAQPILERTTTRRVRSDAEVFVAIDVSRSMLASNGPGARTRFERAKEAASELRARLHDVPVGVATFTDRVLPHLFPTANAEVFEATVDRSIGIERPPPGSSLATNATKLDALASVRGLRYFAPSAKHRLLIVLTDGESTPVAGARLGKVFTREPAITPIFVQFWKDGEQVYTRGAPEPEYVSDPSARALLDGLAASTGGSTYSEQQLGAVARKARQSLGDGPLEVAGQSQGRRALAPYLALAAFVPLGLLLWRRDR